MSWGGNVCNSPSIGLMGVLSFGGSPSELTVGNLETESGGNLLQENGSLILLETQYG